MKPTHQVLVIVGATSSGKSALAVELARRFNGEVISADSRQVYRGLNIGTGKITRKEMRGVRHHLLDVASPTKTFTANDFAQKGRAIISDMAARGKLPIIAGGTGFYIDALLGRISLPDVPPNRKLRERLQKKTPQQLFALLRKKDPQRARSMDTRSERNNKVRLIRALEIAYQPARSPHIRPAARPGLAALWIGISTPALQLQQKIRARLEARIRHGMIAEAKRLHAQGLSYKRMEALGLEYRSLARLLQGKITREQMIDELDRAIRQYAKRQMTYWKRNADIQWFRASQAASIRRGVREWLEK